MGINPDQNWIDDDDHDHDEINNKQLTVLCKWSDIKSCSAKVLQYKFIFQMFKCKSMSNQPKTDRLESPVTAIFSQM